MRCVYMWIDKKNKGLPIAVTDTAKEMAEIAGTTENNVISSAAKAKKEGSDRRFIRVLLEDD